MAERDALGGQLADETRITLASPEALLYYRTQHERVSGAYEAYIKEQEIVHINDILPDKRDSH
ncbi:hypothetical protein KSD_58580 [Ktedonobacter sp. SOSP1-85]|nr:hypothetical protein KSD_58580 [Ktedonobacter sp. SOSP1-85]